MYPNVLPEGLVCRLQSFFHNIARLPFTILSTTPYIEFHLQREICNFPLMYPNIISIFSSEAYELVHHRLAGLGSKSHLLASSTRSRNICSKISFECDMIQELSAHMKLQNLMSSSTFHVQENTLSFPHLFLHIGSNLGCHLATNVGLPRFLDVNIH